MKEMDWSWDSGIKRKSLKPRKVGFLAWECDVKVPGKVRWWKTVRAWTKTGVLKKAEQLQSDLFEEYMNINVKSVPQDPIVSSLPEDIVNPPKPISGPYSSLDCPEIEPITVDPERVKEEGIVTSDSSSINDYNVSTGELSE